MAENSAPSTKKQRRRGPGRPFQPGQSGNPGGRPKGIVAKVKELIGDDGADMLLVLDQIARGALLIKHTDPDGTERSLVPSFKDRSVAAVALLERGFGKPTQPLSGEEGGAIQVIVQKYGES